MKRKKHLTGGRDGLQGVSARSESIHASVFFEKVFKEKLRPDRNVSLAEMDGVSAEGSVLVLPIAALYSLCQLEVG